MKKTLLLIFTFLLVNGCVPSETSPTILEDLVCQPPCWQGIIPGETTEEEVLNFLKESPIIDQDATLRRDNKLGEFDLIHFNLITDISPNEPPAYLPYFYYPKRKGCYDYV